MADSTYEHTRRLTYGAEGATFVPVCCGRDGRRGCGRFVKPDETIRANDRSSTNATCARCGRVQMAFEGYL